MKVTRFGPLIWMAVVLLLGCFMRFYGISNRSIWFDEATSWVRSHYPAYHSPFVTSDPAPPLYFFLLSLWQKLFQSQSSFVLRSLSVCFSIPVLVYSYLLTSKLARAEIAFGVVFFLAFSSLQIAHAQQARMYSLLSLCIVAAAYHLYMSLEKEGEIKGVHLLFFSIWMFLGNQTHFLSLFSFTGFFLWGVFRVPNKNKFFVCLVFFIVLLFSTVFFWPIAHAFLNKLSSAFSFRPSFRPGRELRETLYFLAWYGDILQRPEASPGWVAALFGLSLAFLGLIVSSRQLKVLFFLWLAFPLFCVFSFSLYRNIFYAKYFVYLQPFWMIFMIQGAYPIAQRFKTPSIFLIVILSPLFLANFYSVQELHSSDPFPWEKVAFCLQRNSLGKDVWVLSEPGRSMVLDYYLGSGAVARRLPPENGKTMKRSKGGGVWLIFGESPNPERDKAFIFKFSSCNPVRDCSAGKIYAFRCREK